jgi:pimeloyl-ACP methyl ester carboxylesterase
MPDAVLNGIKVSYSQQGRGQPLIMIGGFNSARGMWFLQTRVFKKHFRVITFDSRGSGKSEKPIGPYSIQVMTGDTLALMDHLCITKAHLLGVSMGALVAQEIAFTHPQRVQKLILGSSFSRIDDMSGPTPEMRRLVELPPGKMLNRMAGLMLNHWFYRTLLLPLARVKNRGADLNSVTGKINACMDYDCGERLERIKCPVMVISGTSDRLILPTSSEVLAKGIPQSKLVKIKGGSHLLFIEKSRQFNKEVMKFLKDT